MILLKKKKDLTIRREIWICNDIGADYVREELNFPGVKQVICIVKKEIKNQIIEHQECWYGITSCASSKLSPCKILKKVVSIGKWKTACIMSKIEAGMKIGNILNSKILVLLLVFLEI